MKQTGTWQKSRTAYTNDYDYMSPRGIMLAFVRPEGDKWDVLNMLDKNYTPEGITCNTLEEAKAVAEALVAMQPLGD